MAALWYPVINYITNHLCNIPGRFFSEETLLCFVLILRDVCICVVLRVAVCIRVLEKQEDVEAA